MAKFRFHFALFFVTVLVPLSAPAQPADLAAEAEALVSRLGSEDFQEREAAERRLLEIGEPALDALLKGRKSPDREIDIRSGRIIGVLSKRRLAEIRQWDDHEDIVWAVAFSPDSRRLATAGGGRHKAGEWSTGSDFAIRIRDVETGQLLKRLEGHTGSVSDLAWSPDGSRLYSSSGDAMVKAWDVASGKELRTFKGHTGNCSSLALSKDGKRLLTGSWDATAILWNTDTGDQIRNLGRHHGRVWDVDLSPDGKLAAVCGDHNAIRLLNADTGELVGEMQGHEQAAVRVAFSPSSKWLLSGGWDNTARLWSVDERITLHILRHEGRVEGIAYSADGTRVMTASLDRRVRMWDVSTGDLVHRYEGHADSASRVAISPDGRFAASGGWDHVVRLWPIPK